jgi:hypothetical protein
VAQVALSAILLVGAGLFVRTLANLKSIDMGFRADRVMTLSLEPRAIKPTDWEALLQRVRATPGVDSASLSLLTPLSGRDRGGMVKVPGFQPRSAEESGVHINHVSNGYIETLHIPLAAGRSFSASDNAGSKHVAILNETAARFYFGNRSPLGTTIDFGKNQFGDGI